LAGDVVVGIDIGTTKVCTLVGEVRTEDIHIVGVGIEPSRGMRKGVVNDVNALTSVVSSSIHKAERSSGYAIGRAFVSVAGAHIDSRNSRGVIGVNSNRGVQLGDLEKALEAARTIALPYNREVLHIIPRSYNLDGQDGIRTPIGMHGFRLEVEAHIITAAASSLQNLEKCIEGAGVYVDRFIFNPLASGEVVLTDAEREMGVMVIDIGGGTTDIAVFLEGTVWHTAVIPVGGWHLTNDIAQGLHLPYEIAEAHKIEHGHADPRQVDANDIFIVQPFGEEHMTRVQRSDLAHIVQPRVEELFQLVQRELKFSGYEGLLSAGAVLTGGSAQLPGIKQIATDILNIPTRVARPERITGMADQLRHPSYSTSVGLLRLGLVMDREDERRGRYANKAGGNHREGRSNGDSSNGEAGKRRMATFSKMITNVMKRLLPEDDK
jgi:cell division protein FtsA